MRQKFRQLSHLEPWQDQSVEPYIVIEDLCKDYDGVPVLQNINLEIYQGEFFCLLGASGCGKTTLLRILAGFETPTSGRVLINGEDITQVPPYKRPVNMMFQSYALFPHMSVAKNVAFGLHQEKLDPHVIRARVSEGLRLVQMERYKDRKPHQLSGGQRQRVALARSLVKQPQLLLLDEPLAALDKKLREETQFELDNIQEKVGVTFMMVTHDQEEAMTIASRIAVMEEGCVAQVGTPHEIYEYPATRYVADFVGTTNLLHGLVVHEEMDHMRIEGEGLEMPLRVEPPSGAPVGASVSVSLRPEKIKVSQRQPRREYNVAKGIVEDIAYLGDVSIYHVRLEGHDTIMQAMVPNMERLAEGKLTWEDAVYLTWETDAMVVLQG